MTGNKVLSKLFMIIHQNSLYLLILDHNYIEYQCLRK